jgi:hypothetical protein
MDGNSDLMGVARPNSHPHHTRCYGYTALLSTFLNTNTSIIMVIWGYLNLMKRIIPETQFDIEVAVKPHTEEP